MDNRNLILISICFSIYFLIKQIKKISKGELIEVSNEIIDELKDNDILYYHLSNKKNDNILDISNNSKYKNYFKDTSILYNVINPKNKTIESIFEVNDTEKCNDKNSSLHDR